MLKYKIGDKVKVMAGKDKGRVGTIEKIFPKKGTAIVQGVNIYKKHIKKKAAKDEKGGIYEIPRALRLEKLSVLDPKSGSPTRVNFQKKDGKKVRIATKSGIELGKKLAKLASTKKKK
mgnify:CR=1 FL=1